MRIGSSSHKVAAFLLALALLIQPALAEVSKLDRYTVCIVDEQNNGSVVTEKVWFEDARGGGMLPLENLTPHLLIRSEH